MESSPVERALLPVGQEHIDRVCSQPPIAPLEQDRLASATRRVADRRQGALTNPPRFPWILPRIIWAKQ